MTTGTESRDAALDILRAVRTGQLFDHALSAAIPGLSDPDRRLAHEIAAGVLRERTALDGQIAAALTTPSKPLPDDVRDLLRIGVYQISYLDRVPPYAAVQTVVELAKDECGRKYAPLVNAVLRKVARTGGGDLRSTEPANGTELAERYSHPSWLVERWLKRYGSRATEQLLRHNNSRPPLVIQPARWSSPRLESALDAAGLEILPGPLGYGFAVTTKRVRNIPGFSEGAFIVQDSTQRRLVDFIAASPTAVVWDACAAPGGKAAILAQSCAVVASDISVTRILRLRENLSRTAPDTPIVAVDARFPTFDREKIDVVLIDAPCSATGAFARHPDARWRLSPDRIASLARLQSELLDGTATAVRRGGLLVYLTCSLEPEENERQVARFLDRHGEFSREGADLSVFPSGDGEDGGFGARMRRAA